MRTLLIAAWLLVPVGVWAYHEGPGQEGMQLDRVDALLADARAAADEGDWAAAAEHYEAALKELPNAEDDSLVSTARRIRLSAAKAKLTSSQLVESRKELIALMDELSEDESANAKLLDETREAYANAQYYWTWLMRLEGYPRSEWEPEVELARQNYRLLAERAETRGDESAAKTHMEDLESTIKLARLDLEELQGLPLPSQ